MNPLPIGWRLWAQIAGGIVVGGVCLDLVHKLIGL
jgi:hypothetical protein